MGTRLWGEHQRSFFQNNIYYFWILWSWKCNFWYYKYIIFGVTLAVFRLKRQHWRARHCMVSSKQQSTRYWPAVTVLPNLSPFMFWPTKPNNGHLRNHRPNAENVEMPCAWYCGAQHALRAVIPRYPGPGIPAFPKFPNVWFKYSIKLYRWPSS